MIIKLEGYNEIRELLIENRTTGSQVHVCYQDGGWRVSVTRVAVHTHASVIFLQYKYIFICVHNMHIEYQPISAEIYL